MLVGNILPAASHEAHDHSIGRGSPGMGSHRFTASDYDHSSINFGFGLRAEHYHSWTRGVHLTVKRRWAEVFGLILPGQHQSRQVFYLKKAGGNTVSIYQYEVLTGKKVHKCFQHKSARPRKVDTVEFLRLILC